MSIIKKKFTIEGMHCTSCAMNIDFDLEDLPGIKIAKTSYAKQQTQVTYDEEKVTAKNICETIGKTGYKASLATK